VPRASVEFVGGPHDGLVLDVDERERFCHLVRLRGEDRDRDFAMMPPLLEWDRVIRGDLDRDGPFETLFPYPFERRGDRGALLFRRRDEFTDAASRSRG
jgi:hypothetical protein